MTFDDGCKSWCSHGGRCNLDDGHTVKHSSGYCEWSDAEALTRAQADEVLAGKPGGAGYLSSFGLLEGSDEDEGRE